MESQTNVKKKNRFKDRVAQIYYTHGLFCASHPYAVFIATILIFSFCCYPLLSYQLTGNASLEYIVSLSDFTNRSNSNDGANSSFNAPRWFNGEPLHYVQQIIIKSAVAPWQDNLIPSDAFKGPLFTVFSVLEATHNFQVHNGSQKLSLSDVCLQVSEFTSKVPLKLPQYSCLVISPANIWSQDIMQFKADSNLVQTVFQNVKSTESYNFNINEIYFGVAWKETGLKKYYVRSRQRVITYSITIILKEYNRRYVEMVKKHLFKIFNQDMNETVKDQVVNVYFETQYHIIEFIPLAVAYIILFLYIYFSVRKIEHVKSKWALATSAVATVVASLLMSVSLCARFGLSFTLYGGEIFPYLVAVIGLENMLVITNSIVSTPPYLDVKIRVAQGLSKEGWSITKNLFTELCILTVGFFTFVPVIQEFCLFAVVGFLTDFFLQLVFFSTILSIDIRGMELSDIHKQGLYHINCNSNSGNSQVAMYRCSTSKLPRSKSAPKLQAATHSDVMTHGTQGLHGSAPTRILVPKRLKFIYFWARTRMVQRAFMLIMVAWISVVIYKFLILGYLGQIISASNFNPAARNGKFMVDAKDPSNAFNNLNATSINGLNGSRSRVNNELLRHKHDNWRALSGKHWPTLFGFYNISLYGRYISILPPIELSLHVNPDDALRQRHPDEIHIADKLKKLWSSDKMSKMNGAEDTLVTSREKLFFDAMENDMLLLVIIALPSVAFLIYFMFVLYRCICNRNYAEWRSSWHPSHYDGDQYSQTVHVETLPKTLSGHIQEVECIAVNGSFVASSCLAGEIIVWDGSTGECLSIIRRSSTPRTSSHLSANELKEKCDSSKHENIDNAHDGDRMSWKCSRSECKTLSMKRLSAPSSLLESHRNTFNKSFNELVPNLSDTIGTDFAYFSSSLLHDKNPSKLCFANFTKLLEQHKLDQCMEKKIEQSRCTDDVIISKKPHHIRSLSMGQSPPFIANSSFTYPQPIISSSQLENCSSIWCLDYKNNLIVAGCADGNVEFWNSINGSLFFINTQNSIGVTSVKIVGNIVIIARLSGSLDFIIIEHENNGTIEENVTAVNVYNRGTKKTLCQEPEPKTDFTLTENNIICKIYHSFHAHQQPISVFVVEGGRIITGSHDKTLKVVRLEDGCCLFTLHGHAGAITAIHVDQLDPTVGASGSEDGTVCMWDLMTGACIYQLSGHPRGSVLALLYTHTHVISSGTDNRICIWERQQGHLLHSLHVSQSYCNSIMMLTSNILVTAKQGSLVLWDINEGEPIRIVQLGNSDSFISIHQMKHLPAGVIVDYGQLLKVIPFPTMTERIDRQE